MRVKQRYRAITRSILGASFKSNSYTSSTCYSCTVTRVNKFIHHRLPESQNYIIVIMSKYNARNTQWKQYTE